MKNYFLLAFCLILLVFSFYTISADYSGTLTVGVGSSVEVIIGNPVSFNVTLSETCTTGQTTCVGTNYYLCVSSHWVNQGNVNGQCGYSTPSGGGGGGGGGLDISSATTSVACSEKWQCSDWSVCVSPGVQTRICTDANNCGTTKNKPAESQDCILAEQTTSTGFLGLTGAAIGSFVKSGEGVATLTGLITIIVASIAVITIRKSRLAKAKNIEVKKE